MIIHRPQVFVFYTSFFFFVLVQLIMQMCVFGKIDKLCKKCVRSSVNRFQIKFRRITKKDSCDMFHILKHLYTNNKHIANYFPFLSKFYNFDLNSKAKLIIANIFFSFFFAFARFDRDNFYDYNANVY